MARKTKKRRYSKSAERARRRRYRRAAANRKALQRLQRKLKRMRSGPNYERNRKRRQQRHFKSTPRQNRGRIFRKESGKWVFVDYLTSNVPVSTHKSEMQRWFKQDYGPGVYKFVPG